MRIIQAGCESWVDLFLELKIKNSLLSYFYLRDKMVKSRREGGGEFQGIMGKIADMKKSGCWLMLDSGAYTYQSKQAEEEKAGHATLPPVREFFDEYKQFVINYGHNFSVIAELDVDGCADGKGGFIGVGDVDEMTNELLETRHHGKIMPVYHENRGQAWLRDWLMETRSPYIGYGSGGVLPEVATAFITTCHLAGKFVHGFGQAGVKTSLFRRPFDSVDASTWLRADKYGGSFLAVMDTYGRYITHKVLTHKEKHRRMGYLDFYKRFNLDPALIAKDDLVENRKATLIAWREIARWWEEDHKPKWQEPYMWTMAQRGEYPDEHPLITRVRGAGL